MTLFDLILFTIFCGFVFYGLFFGLVRALGSLIAVVIAVFAAAHFYLFIAQFLGNFFPMSGFWNLIIFFSIFIIVNRLISLLVSLADKAFNIISIIPFLKSINRLAGAAFGIVEGLFVILIIFYIINTSFLDSWLGNMAAASKFTPYLNFMIKLFKVFFPNLFEKLLSLF